jgi:predicted O-methyltransferase YrrM
VLWTAFGGHDEAGVEAGEDAKTSSADVVADPRTDAGQLTIIAVNSANQNVVHEFAVAQRYPPQHGSVRVMHAEAIIDEIRQQRTVTSADGKTYPIQKHGIDVAEGRFLSEFIAKRPNITLTLEVGCAYGLSSLHIASALAGRSGAHHVIIDPLESTTWRGIGVTNLDRAGVDFYELREEPSETALPRLLEEGAEFDLVFIDGWHTFDQTLVDMYYANRLLKTGGHIIVDDATWPSVSKAVSYFASYPCYEIVGGTSVLATRVVNLLWKLLKPIAETIFPRWLYDYFYRPGKYPSMVALQKVAADDRSYKWFRSF